MPTIEIASLNSNGLDLNQDDFDVAIIEENKLKSHRGLFYDFLLNQQGIIIHIGNPDLKTDKEGGYFAGGIINWHFKDPYFDKKRKGLKSNRANRYANQRFNFQFRQEYREDINRILLSAISKSPINKIYFLTDYQFGPEAASFKTIDRLIKFWEEHDSSGLSLNTLYEISEK